MKFGLPGLEFFTSVKLKLDWLVNSSFNSTNRLMNSLSENRGESVLIVPYRYHTILSSDFGKGSAMSFVPCDAVAPSG